MKKNYNKPTALPFFIIVLVFFLAFLFSIFTIVPSNLGGDINFYAIMLIILSPVIIFLLHSYSKISVNRRTRNASIKYYDQSGSISKDKLGKKISLCPNCNFKLEPNDQFCGNCGFEL